MSGDYSGINRNSIICDASSLIALADACLLDSLSLLKQHMYGDFLYPRKVRYESIEHPLNIKEYSLRALRLMDYERTGVIKLVDADVSHQMNEVMNTSNTIFSLGGKPIKLVDAGEAAQVAIAMDLGVRVLLIDERTTRTLIEAPFKLKEHLEHEFKRKVSVNERQLDRFTDMVEKFRVIRSSEIIMLAYKYGYFDSYKEYKEKALQSALYVLKYSGCSISFEEIEEAMNAVAAGRI
ncbi:MAG: hypothetical protein QXU54_03715 [Candidatus Micrarchaeia archaeon]